MASIPLRAFGSRIAVVLISATAIFGSVSLTSATVVSYHDDLPLVAMRSEEARPAFDAELADMIRSFRSLAARAPRFDLGLTVLPAVAGLPAAVCAAGGPGRALVTPGRASHDRQSVPSRSRRKLRVWERDTEV